MANPAQDLPISIIVPTYNRRERLARLLDALAREHAAGSRFEVVVVVDGATDGTDAMLAALDVPFPLRVLTQANAGPAAARNRGIEVATGELLLFLDDDVVPAPGMVERHRAAHLDDPQAVVIGPMEPPPGERLAPWLRWEAATLQKQYDAMIAGEWSPTPRQFYTANASVRRAHAATAGGFDERFTRAEDVEFAYRLRDHGLRFHFLPAAAVLHEPDRTLESWMRVAYEYGRHDVLMARDLDRAFVLENALREWNSRHPLNRLLPRWCVGHPWRMRVARSLLSAPLGRAGTGVPRRIQRAACSALWSIQYWQGVQAAMGSDPWAREDLSTSRPTTSAA